MPPLQIGAQVYEPYAYPCSLRNLNPRPKCPMPGSDAEILSYLLRLSKIPYNHKVYKGYPWGMYINGTWTGLLGLLRNGSIDTINVRYRHLKLRTEYFEFSYPVINMPVGFLVRKGSTGIGESTGIVFQVFHPILWAFLIAAVIAVGLGMITITVWGSQTIVLQTIPDSLFSCFRLLINQYEPVGGRNIARNLLFVWGSFLTLIFLSLYQNGLLAQLLIPRTSNPFQSTADLVNGIKSGQFRFAAPEASAAFFQYVNEAENDFTKSLKEALKANPVQFEPNMTKIVNLVASGTHVYVDAFDVVLMLSGKNCFLQVATVPDIFRETESFIFRKNDPRLRKLNQATKESIDFTGHVEAKYKKSVQSKCPQQSDSTDRTRPLNITSLSGTLLLLVAGLGCAFGFAVVETCLYNRRSCTGNMIPSLLCRKRR